MVLKEMTRMRRRLLDDYIIPALNSGKYKNKLYWLNKEKGIFRIYWSHKNAAKWQSDDTIVFQDWDRLKGHFKPEGKNYFMCAKQRFRAALYKLSPYVKQLKCPEKFHRDYQLVADGSRRRCENLLKSKSKVTKRIHPCAIPTSVICKNTSYIAKPAIEIQKRMSPPPACHPPMDDQKVLALYSSSMERLNQLRKSRLYENLIQEEDMPQKNTREVHETSVLRENSSTSRIPHIAPQPVPVYCSYKQHYTRHHHPLQDCPEVFVSKIYSGPENVPQVKDETQSSMYNTDEDMCSGILNLSVKSDVSDAPSR